MTTITFTAVETKNLDTVCLRGSAPLADLTRISQADVFDQDSNAEGLQRAVSRKHAIEAHEYVAGPPDEQYPRAFPEVWLNIRDTAVVKTERLLEADPGQGIPGVVRLTFDLSKLERARSVKVSRMDGNHRLLFGAGDGKERPALDAMVPFQLHVGLSPDQEASLFLDVNANHKGLNTSHLHVMRSRLTPEDVELQRHPERVYARRLAEDPTSPWHDLVHMGGAKAGAKDAGKVRPVNFVALESGVKRMLSKSNGLKEMTSTDGVYGLIRTFWQAQREVMPEAWDNHADFLVLKNIGVIAWSTFGATVIDRALALGEVERDQMMSQMVEPAKALNWHKDSPDVLGKSGNRAALHLAGQLADRLPKLASSRRKAREPRPVAA